MCSSSETNVKKEAIWALANATSGGAKDQMDFLFKLGIVKTLMNILETSYSKNNLEIATISLEALINIAEASKLTVKKHEENYVTLETILKEINCGNSFELFKKYENKFYLIFKLKYKKIQSSSFNIMIIQRFTKKPKNF